jgi:UDP-2-acetamido-3-amino-2,3-dideoxy-glucuronate N-acetyltransferase
VTRGIDPTATIHPTAVVDEGAVVGPGSRIWHFSHVMGSARIGAGCSLGQGCFVGERVAVGDRVKVQNHVSLFEGVELEDDVFCGPSVVFSNVKHPRAHVNRRAEFQRTRVRTGATIGANATVLPGVEIGCHAFIGAGATVTSDVPDFALVVGVPARRVGYVGHHGEPLHFDCGEASCPVTGRRYRLQDGRVFEVERP